MTAGAGAQAFSTCREGVGDDVYVAWVWVQVGTGLEHGSHFCPLLAGWPHCASVTHGVTEVTLAGQLGHRCCFSDQPKQLPARGLAQHHKQAGSAYPSRPRGACGCWQAPLAPGELGRDREWGSPGRKFGRDEVPNYLSQFSNVTGNWGEELLCCWIFLHLALLFYFHSPHRPRVPVFLIANFMIQIYQLYHKGRNTTCFLTVNFFVMEKFECTPK